MSPDAVDVAFMFPPGRQSRSFEHHLGVAYIQAYLAKHGITSRQVTPALGSTLIDCAEQLIATDAKVIGFTSYDSNYFLVRIIASLIKHRKPEIVVIAGGPTATFSDNLLLTYAHDIDFCVRFEGEETTLELVSFYLDGKLIDTPEDIAGLTYRLDSSIVRTKDRQLFGINNDKECGLDGLPSPYLDGILDGSEGAGILTARGCTHHCTYCNFSAMSKHTIRYHSIDRIIEELRYIYAANSSSSTSQVVRIFDDAFSLNARRAKKICERIIDEEIGLKLACLCRADNLDEELVDLLHQAGFIDISFGVESAVPRILHDIKKTFKTEHGQLEKEDYAYERRFLSKIKEGIDLAKLYGMKTSVSIILGLPGETIDDALKTIEFIRDLGVDSYSHNYLQIFPGTELFKTAKSYGITLRSSEFLLPYDTHHAYPVHKIPFLDNSSLKDLCHGSAKIVLDSFAGGLNTSKPIGNGILMALIEAGEGNSFLNSFKWLLQALAVEGRVVALGRENDTIENFDLMLRDGYKIGLPTDQLYYLKSCSFPDAELIYEIINKPLQGKLLQWNPRFPLIRFSESLDFAKKLYPMQDQLFPVFCLSEKADVQFLAEIADILAQKVKSGAIGPKVWLDGVFLDGCRWGVGLCPALKLQRVIINNCAEILPCINGQPLGELTDDIQDIRNNAGRIYARIRENRKCEECPADSRCSKCLFPYPLNQQEYCELQRANSNISGIVTRSNLVNTVELGR